MLAGGGPKFFFVTSTSKVAQILWSFSYSWMVTITRMGGKSIINNTVLRAELISSRSDGKPVILWDGQSGSFSVRARHSLKMTRSPFGHSVEHAEQLQN